MIYCPKCGTANREGSKFCNECGEKLSAQTQVKCPHCGSLNSIQSVFCSECGGRLLVDSTSASGSKASPPIKGLSLPTKPSAVPGAEVPDQGEEPEQEDLPAWLRDLSRSSRQGTSAGQAAPDGGTEIPDWLQDLRVSLPEEGAPKAEETEEPVPDWLADLQSSARAGKPEPEPELEPAEEEEEGVPDWLAGLRWSAQADKPEPEPELEPAEEEEEGVPDWLADLRSSARAGKPEPEPELEPAEEEEEGVPDWLAELRSLAPAGEAEPEPEFEAEAEEEKEEGEAPDWLAELRPQAVAGEAEPEPEFEAEAEEEEEGEAPDWLAELRPQALAGEAEPEPEPEAEEQEEGAPDWLAELRPQALAGEAEPEPEPEAEAEEEEEGEVPDWLAGLQLAALAGEAEPAPEAEAEAGEIEGEEIPDWLAEVRPPTLAGEAEPEPAFEDKEGEEGEEALPEWMAELQMPAPEAEPELELEAKEEEQEAPDWLAEIRLPDQADELEPEVRVEEPKAEEASVQPEAVEPEIPDWLAELGSAEEEPSTPEEVLAQGASMPGWLEGLRADLPAEPELPGEEALAEAEIPDWLVPSEMAGEEDALVRAEIPAWLLELKPRELKTDEEEQASAEESILEEPVEETGLLAGIQGVLPIEMLIAQPRAAAGPRPADRGPSDSAQARLFAEIVAQPTVAPFRTMVEPSRHKLSRIVRWILAIALIAAATVPLLLKDPLLTRPVEPTSAMEALFTAINSLDEGSPVLVAFDYDPSTSDEMNVIAEAIVGHLMDRGARVVAISLLPAGAATAESLLEFLAAGRPYVNLGYLPGDVAAIRLLGQSLRTAQVSDYGGTPVADLPMMDGITTIQDFDMLIDLTGAQNSVRWWIEQLGTPYGIPMGAGVSAAIYPIALSYYETASRQLVGVVGGVPDAAAYDARLNGQEVLTGPLALRLDSQLAGHAVLVLVLLVGNVVYLVQRGTGRNR